MKKILLSLILILCVVIVGELLYLFFYKPLQIELQATKAELSKKLKLIPSQDERFILQWLSYSKQFQQEKILTGSSSDYTYEFVVKNVKRINKQSNHKYKVVASITFNTTKGDNGFYFTQTEMDRMTVTDDKTKKKLTFDDLKNGDKIRLLMKIDMLQLSEPATLIVITRL